MEVMTQQPAPAGPFQRLHGAYTHLSLNLHNRHNSLHYPPHLALNAANSTPISSRPQRALSLAVTTSSHSFRPATANMSFFPGYTGAQSDVAPPYTRTMSSQDGEPHLQEPIQELSQNPPQVVSQDLPQVSQMEYFEFIETPQTPMNYSYGLSGTGDAPPQARSVPAFGTVTPPGAMHYESITAGSDTVVSSPLEPVNHPGLTINTQMPMPPSYGSSAPPYQPHPQEPSTPQMPMTSPFVPPFGPHYQRQPQEQTPFSRPAWDARFPNPSTSWVPDSDRRQSMPNLYHTQHFPGNSPQGQSFIKSEAQSPTMQHYVHSSFDTRATGGFANTPSSPATSVASVNSNIPSTSIDALMKEVQSRDTSLSMVIRTRRSNSDSKVYKEKKFRCGFEGCGKTFQQRTHLDIHHRSHTGYKPYPCLHPGCGLRFSQAGNLRTHERRHTGVKPFPCAICGKKFAQRGNVKAHQIVHKGEKPFLCEIEDSCHKRFTQLGNLKSHMNKFHREAIEHLQHLLQSGVTLNEEEQKKVTRLSVLFVNCNKGIKGRGKDRRVAKRNDGVSGLFAMMPQTQIKPDPADPTLQSPGDTAMLMDSDPAIMTGSDPIHMTGSDSDPMLWQ